MVKYIYTLPTPYSKVRYYGVSQEEIVSEFKEKIMEYGNLLSGGELNNSTVVFEVESEDLWKLSILLEYLKNELCGSYPELSWEALDENPTKR